MIEPFTGSASIFMNTDYAEYLLAEQNKDLISLFRHVQTEGESFIRYCERFFSEKNNNVNTYLNFREKFNQSTRPRQRAALLLYLNRHGYNGLCRYNLQGKYNVPFGRYAKPYFPRAELHYFHQKSQGVRLLHADFSETFTHAREGDFIYCDPPYAPMVQTSNFTSYTSVRFGEAQQRQLALLAKSAAERGVLVIISNHDTEATRSYYEFADIHAFSVKRTINCQSQHRRQAKELIAIFR